MALLPILTFPDKRLRTVAEPVDQVDDQIKQLIDDLFETMYDAPGIGLAATQVNVHKRVLVVDVSPDNSQPLAFVNPELVEFEGDQTFDEGCLSVPGYQEEVHRYNEIKVKALNRDGEEFLLECDGLLAVCIQHEMDHLQGKLFVDYLSKLKRQRIQKKLEKLNS